jgi:small GTP-binding protein
MPANLTPQYLAAEDRYKKAKDNIERLNALKEMLALIPKHKGTEKLQGDIKRKIARIKSEIDSNKYKKGKRKFFYSIEKEGVAQVALVGAPNAGKTSLINSLTNTNFETASYPYTTRIIQIGMMKYEDIQIQMVDLPPLSKEYFENWVPSIIKQADIILLVIDISSDYFLNQIDIIVDILDKNKIMLNSERIEKEDYKWKYIKSIVVGNKIDLDGSIDNFNLLKELYDEQYPLVIVSARENVELENLKNKIFELLDLVRIYSKRPGHIPDMENPFTFPRGSTLMDFAQAVHKDFSESLKFARVWGKSKFQGQRITKEYILEDKDIIELHI